jgi:isopentenyl phosphate kinase
LVGNVTILKLGGSAITRKAQPSTPNTDVIKRLAHEIKKAHIKPLIIVHGGGSMAHPIAKKFRIKEGYQSPAQLTGFSKTHYAMVKLNELILDALIRQGLPAVSLQPSASVMTENGRIRIIETKPLLKLLELDCIPVLYGDAVLDTVLGFTILSGDQLASNLAVNLKANRMVIGVDVDGVYTADPKLDPTARLVKEITLGELRKLKTKIGISRAPDVTGGMLGKVNELIAAIEVEVPTIIVNATKPNRVYKALKGERVVGTVITAGE